MPQSVPGSPSMSGSIRESLQGVLSPPADRGTISFRRGLSSMSSVLESPVELKEQFLGFLVLEILIQEARNRV